MYGVKVVSVWLFPSGTARETCMELFRATRGCDKTEQHGKRGLEVTGGVTLDDGTVADLCLMMCSSR